ncbi:MAG: diguanylate cyclase [Ferruginibacter sp.]
MKYHFFIAHSAIDTLLAKQLFNLLDLQFEVFLDSESLLPGDLWDVKIPEAQAQSYISIILSTENTETSFYEKEEISTAIALNRQNPTKHKVIPLFVGDTLNQKDVPYGLRRIFGIHVKNELDSTLVQRLHKSLSQFGALSVKFKPFDYLDDPEGVEKKLVKTVDKSAFTNTILKLMFRHFSEKRITFLIYFDIDNFNAINRIYSKEIGNKILLEINKIVASAAPDSLRKNINSDEFIICPTFYGEDMTVRLIEHIRESIMRFDWEIISPKLYVTASFGYAELLFDSYGKSQIEQMNQWIVRAIHGCFRAKKKGGNCYFKGPLFLPPNTLTDYEKYGS